MSYLCGCISQIALLLGRDEIIKFYTLFNIQEVKKHRIYMSMHRIQTENAQKTRNERAILCQMSYYDSKGDNL